MNNDNEKLLKAKQVAELLQVSRSLAYRLMQDGTIPTVRFGGSVRVWQQDLMVFIQDHRIEPQA